MSAASLTTLPPAAWQSLLDILPEDRCCSPLIRIDGFRLGCRPVACDDVVVVTDDHCPPCDAGQYRLWWNQARRENDQLRLQIDRLELSAAALVRSREVEPGVHALTSTAADAQRRSYAPLALGDVSHLPAHRPPIVEPRQVYTVPVVTNLGTLMDVLT